MAPTPADAEDEDTLIGHLIVIQSLVRALIDRHKEGYDANRAEDGHPRPRCDAAAELMLGKGDNPGRNKQYGGNGFQDGALERAAHRYVPQVKIVLVFYP